MPIANIHTGTKTLLIILLCFATRTPQLISHYLILDGDECVVGIMARHISEGKSFPLFFIGQQYGLSIFECLVIIPFYALLGYTTLAVKLAMLCLWTTGIVFFYKTMVAVNKKNAWMPIILTLVFIAAPAWAVWSMKARGGYLTAFCLHSVALYLIHERRWQQKNWMHALIGIIMVLVYESQLLWLPSLVLFYCYQLFKDRNLKGMLYSLSCAVPLFITFHFYQQQLPTYYKPGLNTSFWENMSLTLGRLPEYLYDSLNGYYYFGFIYQPDEFSAIAAGLFIILICIVIGAGVFFIFKKGATLFKLSALAVALNIAPALLTYTIEPRYLLPVTGLTLISVMLLINELKAVKWNVMIAGAVFTGIGLCAQISFKDFSFCDTREPYFKKVLSVLDKVGIHYLFSTDDLFTWQVNFYSAEKVICRSVKMPGRYPPYVYRINRAFRNGEKTAVLGTNNSKSNYKYLFTRRKTVGHYYLCEDPDTDILKEDFEFDVSP